MPDTSEWRLRRYWLAVCTTVRGHMHAALIGFSVGALTAGLLGVYIYA